MKYALHGNGMLTIRNVPDDLKVAVEECFAVQGNVIYTITDTGYKTGCSNMQVAKNIIDWLRTQGAKWDFGIEEEP